MMKKMLLALTATLLAMGIYLAPGQAAPDHAMPDQARQNQEPSEEPIRTEKLPGDKSEELVPMVSCGVYQGQRCTGSSRPRCDLAPGEPALCLCVNGTFQCS
jgi:hypothetical protein